MENFKYAKKSAEKRQFTVNTDISAVPPAAAANMKRFAVSISQCPEIRAVTVSKPIPESVKKSIEKAANAAVNGGGGFCNMQKRQRYCGICRRRQGYSLRAYDLFKTA